MSRSLRIVENSEKRVAHTWEFSLFQRLSPRLVSAENSVQMSAVTAARPVASLQSKSFYTDIY